MYEDLISRLSEATEGDRELDCEIAVAVLGGEIEWKQANYTMDLYPVRRYDSTMHVGGKGSEPVERYTESVDAALSLLPEGKWWGIAATDTCAAECSDIFVQGKDWHADYGHSPVPAIALCISFLRARAACAS